MMMMNRIMILSSLLAFIIQTGYSQENTLIVGEWVLKERQSNVEISETIIGGKKVIDEVKLTFYRDSTGYDYSSSTKFEYLLYNEYLIIGNRRYLLIELTKDKLIIEEPENLLSIDTEKLIFTKIEN